jgi:DNA-directed RNA polymerase specialized sigma24 family protein
VTELLAARFGAGYQVTAGLDRFGTWLREHATEDETGPEAMQASSPAAIQAGHGARCAAILPAPGHGEAANARTIPSGPGSIRGENPGAEPGPDADRAMTALYEGHYSSLVRLAALLVGDMAAAEKIVQDSFVALRHARQRRDGDSALCYLRQSVVNRSRSVPPGRAGKNAAAGATGSPGSQPGTAEYPAVIAALSALPARQRAALVLRYYADFSAAQIAEVMGISEGAVSRHLQRATASLREVLDGS